MEIIVIIVLVFLLIVYAKKGLEKLEKMGDE